MYGLPGGIIEYGEPMSEALVREAIEETGLKIVNFEYVGVLRETQEEHEFIHFVFSAVVGDVTPELKEPEKCEGWEWIDIFENNFEFKLRFKRSLSIFDCCYI